jgi:hypothetical protein
MIKWHAESPTYGRPANRKVFLSSTATVIDRPDRSRTNYPIPINEKRNGGMTEWPLMRMIYSR